MVSGPAGNVMIRIYTAYRQNDQLWSWCLFGLTVMGPSITLTGKHLPEEKERRKKAHIAHEMRTQGYVWEMHKDNPQGQSTFLEHISENSENEGSASEVDSSQPQLKRYLLTRQSRLFRRPSRQLVSPLVHFQSLLQTENMKISWLWSILASLIVLSTQVSLTTLPEELWSSTAEEGQSYKHNCITSNIEDILIG